MESLHTPRVVHRISFVCVAICVIRDYYCHRKSQDCNHSLFTSRSILQPGKQMSVVEEVDAQMFDEFDGEI
ncbi:hypothetical protein MPTK1_8g03260 [Marchantia polymorpha subsp. ruderalis]|uniref:Uncharacterized protein n=1 Tax=Marchantia polymorpha TaxID=3197 RepID=A0A2R6XJD3_MARPO|nr:hypothetical protein MARPO_0012s0117 [Marchantia polymorpha]BBN18534.1 hypothetical protein Mp_8g03260 [Marchantia polymorpha subsp. ruderalis]|eukprot:PTQ46176.1 hypothetical protein MARPO_0012s0117 [Marchantia polymorpha]